MNFLKSLFTFQSSVVPDDGGGGSGDDGVSVNPFDPSVHMSGVYSKMYMLRTLSMLVVMPTTKHIILLDWSRWAEIYLS
jgi:hypothetical protein